MSRIPEVDRQALLRLARKALHDHLADGQAPEIPTGSGALLKPRAVFVTLRHHDSHALRGCVGQVTARGPLVESVIRMAVAAGTEDPRFPPVEPGELPELRIEISALTPMEPIAAEAVEIGKHGLMIRAQGGSGLLLPQVPVEQAWDRETFLAGVCRKAGLPDNAWRDADVELHGFECEVWEEAG
jgi:AmmeMemoRadiSam system protein A